MRKKKIVDLAWLDRPILDFSQSITALNQSTIHHDGHAIGFHQVAGTGYLGFGAEVGYFGKGHDDLGFMDSSVFSCARLAGKARNAGNVNCETPI